MKAQDFKKFPTVFWSANLTELFERAAYYSMASLVVLYLKQIGLGSYWPSVLNGLLWFLIYFLPIFSGSMADHFGFRRALILAFVLLTGGYLLMGTPVWSGTAKVNRALTKRAKSTKRTAAPAPTKPGGPVKRPGGNSGAIVASPMAVNTAPQTGAKTAPRKVNSPPSERSTGNLPVTAPFSVILLVAIGFALIGIGGSIIKPCIAGAVAKFSPAKLATLGFAIFYMVINIGSLVGRLVSYLVRTNTDLSFIFAVSASMTVLALFAVVMKYKEPPRTDDDKRTNMLETFKNMGLVLTQGRFVVFLVIVAGFAFIYHQVYNIIPLYLKHFVEDNPPVDIYTMANPIVIVGFQLLITKLFGKMKPIPSIVVGILLISLAMLINIIPLLLHMDLRSAVFSTLPLGGLYAVITVALIAFGELFQASRLFEFVGKLAPKGQEGLYMGYANLPMALGSLAGGPVGAYIFNDIMVKQDRRVLGWIILTAIGVLSAVSMYLFALWIDRQDKKQTAQA